MDGQPLRWLTNTRLACVTVVIVSTPTVLWGQTVDSAFQARTYSNQPASVPSAASTWPTAGPQTAPDSFSPSPRLTAPVTTSPPERPSQVSVFDPVVPPEQSPESRTPIRRDGALHGNDATTSDETVDKGRPAPADLLKAGAWNSGIAVLALTVGGVVIISVLKKRHPQLTGGLPREVCEVLGRQRLDPQTSVCLVRLGQRILVLGTTGDTISPLAEITDPTEVDQVAGLCRVSEPSGLPSLSLGAFGGLLQKKLKPEPTQPEQRARQQTSRPTTPRQQTQRPDRSSEMADLPGLDALRRGERLDLTTPD